MTARKVVVFGGSGFVGRVICEGLSQRAYQTIVPTRNKQLVSSVELHSRAVLIKELSQKNIDEILGALDVDDVVINLVGILHSSKGEPYGEEFRDAHVDLPNRIMQSMKAHGIKRYIHMSALGANSNGPSMYLRSKGDAENHVKNSDLDWTIFRPSVIFGLHDNFINMFGKLQKFFPVMPLAGSTNLFQPVAVHDVSEAFIQSIQMSQTIHQVYDLAGPEVLTLAQIIQFAAKKEGIKRPIIPLPAWAGVIQALVLEKMPGKKIMSRDNVDSMKIPSILPNGQTNPLQEVFGVKPSSLESLLN
jgi:NADH dehydrogenase